MQLSYHLHKEGSGWRRSTSKGLLTCPILLTRAFTSKAMNSKSQIPCLIQFAPFNLLIQYAAEWLVNM